MVECLEGFCYQAVEYKETSSNPNAKLEDEFKRAVRPTKIEGLEVSNFVILRDGADPDRKHDYYSTLELVKRSDLEYLVFNNVVRYNEL